MLKLEGHNQIKNREELKILISSEFSSIIVCTIKIKKTMKLNWEKVPCWRYGGLEKYLRNRI